MELMDTNTFSPMKFNIKKTTYNDIDASLHYLDLHTDENQDLSITKNENNYREELKILREIDVCNGQKRDYIEKNLYSSILMAINFLKNLRNTWPIFLPQF